jgi:hypothetical protein
LPLPTATPHGSRPLHGIKSHSNRFGYPDTDFNSVHAPATKSIQPHAKQPIFSNQ